MVNRIRVGIAAMAKKANSKPMKQIVRRFEPSIFEFIYFSDQVLLNEPIESWPLVDYLIAWHSGGYPLDKVVEYVNLRHPLLINDVMMQKELLDRRRIYSILKEHNIRTPRHVVLTESERLLNIENENENHPVIIENDDWIEIKGIRFNKPVVEKPIDAEDHNIYIYYPLSAGGGSKRLFRKVGDKSSQFYPEINELRKEGSYIYEEFIETQGVDVKVYTVGPNYGHAEARKSPVIDGKVNRNKDGSETRYPVILSQEEKVFANKVCIAFRQGVCGFDILRVHGKSYVCDVNGWSFVKTSTKYFDDCAQLLSEIIWTSVRHKGWGKFSAVAPLTIQSNSGSIGSTGSGNSIGSGSTPPTKYNYITGSNKLLTRESYSEQDEPFDERATNEIDAEVEAATIEQGKKHFLKRSAHLYSYDEKASLSHPAHSSPLGLSSNNGTMEEGAEENEDDDKNVRVEHDDKTDDSSEELRCVIAVIRHGDRTPKQKLKFVVDLYDQSCDFEHDENHKCLGISSLFLPYFTFFHAFLDAEHEASQAEMNRTLKAQQEEGANSDMSFTGSQQDNGSKEGDGGGGGREEPGRGENKGGGGWSTSSAMKGGLAEAVCGEEENETFSTGATAAAVAKVQTEVLSPPSWSESLIKSFHKLLINPKSNKKRNSFSSSGQEKSTPSPNASLSRTSPSSSSSSTSSSSSSLFKSFGTKKTENGTKSKQINNTDNVPNVPNDEQVSESVNVHISKNEVISIDKCNDNTLIKSGESFDKSDGKMLGEVTTKMVSNTQSSSAQIAAAEMTRSLIVDQEGANNNSSLTRAEGAELLRAARIHLENQNKTNQDESSNSPKSTEPTSNLASMFDAPKPTEPTSKLASMFDAPKPTEPTSNLASMFDAPKPTEPTSNLASMFDAPKPTEPTSNLASMFDAPKPTEPTSNLASMIDAPKPTEPTSNLASMFDAPKPTEPTSKLASMFDAPKPTETTSNLSRKILPPASPNSSSNVSQPEAITTSCFSPVAPPPSPAHSMSATSLASPMKTTPIITTTLPTPPNLRGAVLSPSSSNGSLVSLDQSQVMKPTTPRKPETETMNAPLKRDVKVKSKLGLKSFLATTERVKEMLAAHLASPSSSMEDELASDDKTKSSLKVDETASDENESSTSSSPTTKPSLSKKNTSSKMSETLMYKLQQITDVLGYGEISGVTRKLQIKGLEWAPIYDSEEEDDEEDSSSSSSSSDSGSVSSTRINDENSDIRKFGQNVKTKRSSSNANYPKKLRFRATKVEIILKWGGALTPLGEAQAQYLGETLRKSLYPDPKGGGVLRLHATFRHDLKIRTSDEGRVMKTAASFAKGLLQLEGSLTPILVSLVRKDKGSLQMLDHTGDENIHKNLSFCKTKMNDELQKNKKLTEIDIQNISAIGQESLIKAIQRLENPREKLIQIHQFIGNYVKEIELVVNKVKIGKIIDPPVLYMEETTFLMLNRWKKLYEDFYKLNKKDKKNKNNKNEIKKVKDEKKYDVSVPLDYSTGVFDLSKVPDVLDAIRYDIEHNLKRLNIENTCIMSELYFNVKKFADGYVPQEYGIDRKEKFIIGAKVCSQLLRKIRDDLILGTEGNDAQGSNPDMQYMLDTSHAEYLDVKSLGRHVRTRLYFTSESHLHTLLNVLRYGHYIDEFHLKNNQLNNHIKMMNVLDSEGENAINQNMKEYCYLTHLVIRVFENLSLPKNDNSRFRVELSFSPGANRCPGGLIDNDSDDENDFNEQNNNKIFKMSSFENKIKLVKEFQPKVSDYFENNPNDVVSDLGTLRVAEAVPLNRSLTLSATDLENFLESAMNVAKSGTTAH